jgi:hypothetical protein
VLRCFLIQSEGDELFTLDFGEFEFLETTLRNDKAMLKIKESEHVIFVMKEIDLQTWDLSDPWYHLFSFTVVRGDHQRDHFG